MVAEARDMKRSKVWTSIPKVIFFFPLKDWSNPATMVIQVVETVESYFCSENHGGSREAWQNSRGLSPVCKKNKNFAMNMVLSGPLHGRRMSMKVQNYWGLPGDTNGKELACQCRRHKRLGFNPWVGKVPWRRAWQPTPVFLPRESPGTEEPGGLQSMGLQSQTQLKWLST